MTDEIHWQRTEDILRRPAVSLKVTGCTLEANAAVTDDPYSILKGWIEYAKKKPFDVEARRLRRLSEACLANLMPIKELKDLGK